MEGISLMYQGEDQVLRDKWGERIPSEILREGCENI